MYRFFCQCIEPEKSPDDQTHQINIKIYLKSPGILKCTPKERIWRMHQHRIKCSQTNYLKSPGLGACTKVTSSHHHGLHQVSGWRSYFYNFYLGIWLSNAYVLLNITQNSRCELMFCSCSRLFLNGPCESYQNGGLLVTYTPLKRSYVLPRTNSRYYVLLQIWDRQYYLWIIKSCPSCRARM